jgi:cyanophycin synthetase
VDHLFPHDENGRIPIIGVTGSHGKTIVARLTAMLLQRSGKHVGLACSAGLYFNQRQVEQGDHGNWATGRRVLMNRSVDAAVIENSSHVILRQGLAYDRCQVGIVTNIDETDSLSNYDIRDLDDLYNVLRTQIDVVLPTGTAVLNARDERLVKMAALCDGDVVFFGLDAHLSAIASHLALGKRAVFVRDGYVVLAEGSREQHLCEVAAIPLTLGGHLAFQVENVLAAISAAWALDVPADILCVGVKTFDIDRTDVLGQLTLQERQDTTFVEDAHHDLLRDEIEQN